MRVSRILRCNGLSVSPVVLRCGLEALAMRYRCFAAVLFVALVGCGPTRTTGTKGLSDKDLAVLTVAQLPEVIKIRIHSIQFDGQGDTYEIKSSRDFYLTPGDHTASFTLLAPAPPGIGGWFVPSGALTFPGPKGIPLGAVSAGKAYEFAPNVESFDKLLQEGKLSLVREKVK